MHRFLIDLWKDWKAKRFSWKNPNVRWLAVLGFLEVLSIPSYFRDDGVKMANPVPSILMLAAIMVLAVVARHLGEE